MRKLYRIFPIDIKMSEVLFHKKKRKKYYDSSFYVYTTFRYIFSSYTFIFLYIIMFIFYKVCTCITDFSFSDRKIEPNQLSRNDDT